MLIAIVDFQIQPDASDAALTALLSVAPAVRAMPGCIGYRAFAQLDQPSACVVLHEWATEAAFAGYLASAEFAAIGASLRPLLTAPPVSRRFAANLIETVA